jgi:hypothetical protein
VDNGRWEQFILLGRGESHFEPGRTARLRYGRRGVSGRRVRRCVVRLGETERSVEVQSGSRNFGGHRAQNDSAAAHRQMLGDIWPWQVWGPNCIQHVQALFEVLPKTKTLNAIVVCRLWHHLHHNTPTCLLPQTHPDSGENPALLGLVRTPTQTRSIRPTTLACSKLALPALVCKREGLIHHPKTLDVKFHTERIDLPLVILSRGRN